MSTNSQNVPGMILPTQKGLLAGNPRDSAIAAGNAASSKQASANASVSGGSKRNKMCRRGGAVVVPQFTMQYTSQSGPGGDPNSIIKANSQISTQGTANAVYDSQATQQGGTVHWGCYSGGKKSRRTKKNKKHRKTRKHHKKRSRRT